MKYFPKSFPEPQALYSVTTLIRALNPVSSFWSLSYVFE
jgi:hypothetical protein